MSKIVLYYSVASRSFIALWMLEELGIPFEIADTDIRTRKHMRPEYLKINPKGKVPALSDDGVVITENPAICLYLADKYGYGTLAPKIDDPDRGPYLKWTVYSTAVVDPVATLHKHKIDLPGFEVSFGAFDDMVRVVSGVIANREYLLGARFSAADVVLGGTLARLL